MSQVQLLRDAGFTISECHLIANYAHEMLISVQPWQVNKNIETWRMWYYHMIPETDVLMLPGVEPISMSGR